jgi:hypothetical protein
MLSIMTVQYCEGHQYGYIDYATADVSSMMGKTRRPNVDPNSRRVSMCQQTREDALRKFSKEALPVDSMLPINLWDHPNAKLPPRRSRTS